MKKFIKGLIAGLKTTIKMLKGLMDKNETYSADLQAKVDKCHQAIDQFNSILSNDIVQFDLMANEPIFIIQTFVSSYDEDGDINVRLIEERAFTDKHIAMNYHERIRAVCQIANSIYGSSSDDTYYYTEWTKMNLYK